MRQEERPSIAKLAVAILALVGAGAPLVAYLWDTLNYLLSGIIQPIRLLLAIPLSGLFMLVLKLTAAFVGRWDTARREALDGGAEGSL